MVRTYLSTFSGVFATPSRIEPPEEFAFNAPVIPPEIAPAVAPQKAPLIIGAATVNNPLVAPANTIVSAPNAAIIATLQTIFHIDSMLCYV